MVRTTCALAITGLALISGARAGGKSGLVSSLAQQTNGQQQNTGNTQAGSYNQGGKDSLNVAPTSNSAYSGGNKQDAANKDTTEGWFGRHLLDGGLSGVVDSVAQQTNGQQQNTGNTQAGSYNQGGKDSLNVAPTSNSAYSGGNKQDAANKDTTEGWFGRHLLDGGLSGVVDSVAQQTNGQQQNTGNTQAGSYNQGGKDSLNVAPTSNSAYSGGNKQDAANKDTTEGWFGRHLLDGGLSGIVDSVAQQTNGQQQITGNTQSGSYNSGGDGTENVAPTTNNAYSGDNAQDAKNSDLTKGVFGSRHLLQGSLGKVLSQAQQTNAQQQKTGNTQAGSYNSGGEGALNVAPTSNQADSGNNNQIAKNSDLTKGFFGRHLLGSPIDSVFSKAQQTNAQQQQTGNTQAGSYNKGGKGTLNVAPTSNYANSGNNNQQALNADKTEGFFGRHLLSYPSSTSSYAQQTNAQQQKTGNKQSGSVNSGGFNVAPTWNQAESGGNQQQAANKDFTFGGY